MKRLLVIAAFMVVVLGALGGGVYYFMQGETASPRKPVVAKEAALEPEVVRDNSDGPLGANDRENPDGTIVDDGTDPDKPVQPDVPPDKPDREPVNPDGTPVKPDRTNPGTRPDSGATNPEVPEPAPLPEIVPTEGLVTLAGRVIDDTGEPLAGAGVMLVYNQPVTRESRGQTPASMQKVSVAATDNDGYYRSNVKLVFPSEEGELEIQVWAQTNNGLRSTEDVSERVRIGETYENIDLTVPRGSELMGQVVNQRFEALASVTVFAQLVDAKDQPLRATTDENGAFHFAALKPGSYQVFAVAEGYQPDGEIQVVEVASGQTNNMSTPVKMKPLTALKVRLTATEGQPKGPFTVVFYNGDGKTTNAGAKADAQGNALISGVPTDAIEMVIKCRGYQESARIPVSVIEDDHNDLGEIQLVPATDAEGQ